MKLKFKIQQYQTDAVESTVGVFSGQPNLGLLEYKVDKGKVYIEVNDKRDEFGSRRPIDVIAANNPIIILDEPQKMGGAATQTALARFNPLFTLNYSATHKESHNPVYVLDALDAYNQKLVKKIEVVGFELKNLKGTDIYIYLDDIILSKDKAPQARLEIEVQNRSGNITADHKARIQIRETIKAHFRK